MARDRRVLGQELLEYVDGSTQQVSVYAVSNFDVLRAGRQHKKYSVD